MISKHPKGEKSRNVPSSRYVLAASFLLAMVIFYSQVNFPSATGLASYSIAKIDTEKGTYFALQPQEEKAALRESDGNAITGMATEKNLKCWEEDSNKIKGECKWFGGFGREGLSGREGCAFWESCILVAQSSATAQASGKKNACENAGGACIPSVTVVTNSCGKDFSKYDSACPTNYLCCSNGQAAAAQGGEFVACREDTDMTTKIWCKKGCTPKKESLFTGMPRKGWDYRSDCEFALDTYRQYLEANIINYEWEKGKILVKIDRSIIEESYALILQLKKGTAKSPRVPAQPGVQPSAPSTSTTKPATTTTKPPAAPVRPVTQPAAKPAAVSQNVFVCSVYDETTLTEKIYCRQKCGADAGELPYDTGFDVLKAEGYKMLSDCQAALNKYKDTLKPGDVLGSVPTAEILRERTRADERARPIEKIDIGNVQLVVDGKTYDRYAIIVKYGAAAEQKYKQCIFDEPSTGDQTTLCVTECDPSRTLFTGTKDECEAKRSGAPATPAKRTYCDQLKGECISSSSEAYGNCVIGKGWLRSSASSRESQSCASAGEGDTCCLTWGAKREPLGEKGTTATPAKPAESVSSFPYGRQACVKEGGFLDSGSKCCENEGLVPKNSYCVKESKAAATQETYQLCKDSFGRYQCYPKGKSGCLSTLYVDRECTVTTAQSKAATSGTAAGDRILCTYLDAQGKKKAYCVTDSAGCADTENDYPAQTGISEETCTAEANRINRGEATAAQSKEFFVCNSDDASDTRGYSYSCVDDPAFCYMDYKQSLGADEAGCKARASALNEKELAQGQNYYACLTREGSYGCVSDTSLCSSDSESFGSDKAGCTAKAEQLNGAGRQLSGENVLYGCAVTDATTDVAYSYWCVKDASECLGSYEAYEGDTAETGCWAWADSANNNLLAQTSSSSSGGGGTGEDDDLEPVDVTAQQECPWGFFCDIF